MSKIENYNQSIFSPFSMRIGNLGARNYYNDEEGITASNTHIHPNYDHFEIVKWVPNSYYGKQDEYEPEVNGMCRSKHYPTINVSGRFFTMKEICYTIAYFIGLDNDEYSPDLKFVGDRVFSLSKEEKELFL